MFLPSSTPTSTSTRVEWLYSQHPHPATHPPEKYGITSGMKHTTPTSKQLLTSSTPSFLYNINYNYKLNLSLAQLSPSLFLLFFRFPIFPKLPSKKYPTKKMRVLFSDLFWLCSINPGYIPLSRAVLGCFRIFWAISVYLDFPWIVGLSLDYHITIPGLSKDYLLIFQRLSLDYSWIILGFSFIITGLFLDHPKIISVLSLDFSWSLPGVSWDYL